MTTRPGGQKPPIRRLVGWAGRALALLALAYLAREFHRNWQTIAAWQPMPGQVWGAAGLSLAYALALVLLAENWHRIVGLFHGEPRRRTYPSYIRSHIAKYLPGNVAHLVGRGLLLRGGGLRDRQILGATVLELAAIPAAALAAVLALGAAGSLASLLPWLPLWLWQAGLTLALATGLIAVAAAWLWRPDLRRHLVGLLLVLLLSVTFMAALGALFAALFNLLAPAAYAPLMAAAILGWLAGFLTPGAPGGIGTREAALTVLLAPLAPQDTILIAAVLLRLVTTAGDLLFFAAGWLLVKPEPAATGRP